MNASEYSSIFEVMISFPFAGINLIAGTSYIKLNIKHTFFIFFLSYFSFFFLKNKLYKNNEAT